jgi:hypothetical protein
MTWISKMLLPTVVEISVYTTIYKFFPKKFMPAGLELTYYLKEFNMKFSKSIFIFLFASSILVAFSYALNKTNGNVYKSVRFTFYFLAIKIGLIPINVPLKSNQSQPNQELVSRVQPTATTCLQSVCFDFG